MYYKKQIKRMFKGTSGDTKKRVRISGRKSAAKVTTKRALQTCYKSDRIVELHCEDRKNIISNGSFQMCSRSM